MPPTRHREERSDAAIQMSWRVLDCFIAMLLAMTPNSAFAQTATEGCAAFAWSVADAQRALAGDIAKIASGSVAPQDFMLTLMPTDQVPFPAKPERTPRKPNTFGGFVTLDPPKGATFQVTLSDEAWIDVVQGGAIVKSGAFSGKQGCDGVRKSVRFTLVGSGPVTLQVSGAESQTIKVDLRGVE